jgi:hypothetical protein
MHTHMHKCTHAHMHICTHAHMHTCTCTLAHIYMHTCTLAHIYMHTCTHAQMVKADDHDDARNMHEAYLIGGTYERVWYTLRSRYPRVTKKALLELAQLMHVDWIERRMSFDTIFNYLSVVASDRSVKTSGQLLQYWRGLVPENSVDAWTVVAKRFDVGHRGCVPAISIRVLKKLIKEQTKIVKTWKEEHSIEYVNRHLGFFKLSTHEEVIALSEANRKTTIIAEYEKALQLAAGGKDEVKKPEEAVTAASPKKQEEDDSTTGGDAEAEDVEDKKKEKKKEKKKKK